MPVQIELNEGRVPVQIWTRDVDPAALQQLLHVSRLPIVRGKVAAMPDVHAGIGATVGSVIPTAGAIIPAAVGVDIGCGMVAVRLSLNATDLPDSLPPIRGAIEDAVPVGFAMHSDQAMPRTAVARLEKGYKNVTARNPALLRMQKNPRTWALQLGTLGGGNHFIEICLDEDDRVWVMLHSGSRGIGNQIGRYYIERAKEDMLAKDAQLPDRDLAYLEEGSPNFSAYVEALQWAQDYAAENRLQMLEQVLTALRRHLPAFAVDEHAINCHHNYVALEEHGGEALYVTRKGAIRAGAGELGIIPGSMGAKSYIVRGKGNEASLCSCSHGAGRRMSRSEAKRRYTARDLARSTAGVECRKDAGVVDEIPEAYKDIDQVMADQHDLVEIEHTLRQVVCVKG